MEALIFQTLFHWLKSTNVDHLQIEMFSVISHIQVVPGGKVNILGGHSISHSKQKSLNEHVSYSERFLR